MSVFTRCENGHDLTQENAYVYKSNGNRACRECDPKIIKNRKKPSGSTWHEKRATFA